MASKQVIIAQIGCGYWGPNIVRASLKVPQIRHAGVVELAESRRNYLRKTFPLLPCYERVEEVLDDPKVDAVVIATPAYTHYSLASMCLSKGKHVFIEKPFATTVVDAEALAQQAEQYGKIVMSGHTFLYNSVFQAVKQTYLAGIGDILYFSLRRLNLGKIRTDVNAWWNLAPHDVSILLYLLEELPETISVHGSSYVQGDVEDVVFATLKWKSGVSANIHVSWLDPHKVRECVIVGSKQMLVVDDMADYKLCIHDKGIDRLQENAHSNDFDNVVPEFHHRKGDVLYPSVPQKEPLFQEMEAFAKAILEGKEPPSGAAHSIDVVRILEAGQYSLKNNGETVRLCEVAYA